MIRSSVLSDTDEIARLAIAQYRRLPFLDMTPTHITGWRVRCDHYSLSGCYSYFIGDFFYVTQLWVDDGFRGYRAAVELSRDAEELAKRVGRELRFEISEENTAYARVVATAGYVPIDGTVYGKGH